MKKILIVGCQGYLGSQICKLFIRDKYEVDGIDIGYFKNCEISNTTKINIKKKLAQNITKNDLIKYNVVIQLAAFSNDPLDKHKAKDFYKPTVKYTLKIAQMCKELNIKFIFPSSCSVYGYSMKKLTEKDKPNPLTFYSKNKVEIEKGLLKLKSKEFNPIILRLATVFGFSSRIRFDVVINMICGMSITKNKILLNSNGLAWRPHIHIDDVYEVFKYFVDLKKYTGDMTYNVGRNDNNCRVIDIANLIKKILPNVKIDYLLNNTLEKTIFKDEKISKGVDKRNYKVSFSKISKIKDLKIKYNLEKGIKKLILDLKKVNLSNKEFESKNFYRLQKLKSLNLKHY